jgi:predicted acylesterase/phospholipase RssA
MEKTNIEQFKSQKIALVLSGGIVRAAAWHLGVAFALEDLGFEFKGAGQEKSNSLDISTIVGSSAGAMIGTYLAQGIPPQEIINSIIGIKSDVKRLKYSDILHLYRPKLKTLKANFFSPFGKLPFNLGLILKTVNSISGFFSTEGLRKYLVENVIAEDDFSKLPIDLFIVGTKLDHSQKVIFGKYNYPNPSHDSTANYMTGYKISDAAAASMSVPPFYTPYPIKNNVTNEVDYYIDGEIRETLSTHVAVDNGCDVIISSWTHTPYHYHDEIGSLAHYGIPTIITQSLYLMIQKKIVSHRAQLATSLDIIETIDSYMKSEKFSKKHSSEILKILERKLAFRRNIRLIDIFPDHDDYETFFVNPFTLDEEKTAAVVRKGYKKTMQVFGKILT